MRGLATAAGLSLGLAMTVGTLAALGAGNNEMPVTEPRWQLVGRPDVGPVEVIGTDMTLANCEELFRSLEHSNWLARFPIIYCERTS